MSSTDDTQTPTDQGLLSQTGNDASASSYAQPVCNEAQDRTPTTARLASALEAAGAPPFMIARAWAGFYDEYTSDQPFPIVALVKDARVNRMPEFAKRAMSGEFDAQDWEAVAWAESEEGRTTIAKVVREKAQAPQSENKQTGRRSHHAK